tara:strand:+ start:282 stop:500 length:219 start_codon:yes stop_codon:yes gene_type:complete
MVREGRGLGGGIGIGIGIEIGRGGIGRVISRHVVDGQETTSVVVLARGRVGNAENHLQELGDCPKETLLLGG